MKRVKLLRSLGKADKGLLELPDECKEGDVVLMPDEASYRLVNGGLCIVVEEDAKTDDKPKQKLKTKPEPETDPK